MANNEPKRADYRPAREHVKLISGKEGWAVYLSPGAKIIDLAVITRALRVAMRPEPCEMAAGFLVRPVDRFAAAPTRAQFDAIFEHGFAAADLLPAFMRRQAD